MNALDDFADASSDTSLFTQIGDVFTSFPDDNTRFFGTNERAKSQGIMGRWGRRLRPRRRCYFIFLENAVYEWVSNIPDS